MAYSKKVRFGAKVESVYTSGPPVFPGNILILFAGDAAAVTVPVEDDIQTVPELHAIHDAFAQQAGHFVDVMVSQHAGGAFGGRAAIDNLVNDHFFIAGFGLDANLINNQ